MSGEIGHEGPLVSIILPYFNAEKTLAEALQSIVDQSYKNFQLIAINDHSTDSSEKVAKSFNDPRIIHVLNSGKGLVSALNNALKHTQGSEFIARMDADDVSLPTRIEEQVTYLQKSPLIGLLATWAILYNSDTRILAPSPSNDYFIKTEMLFQNNIIHPTVMFRSSLLKMIPGNLYRDEFKHAEDYALWADLVPHIQFAILEKPLLRYRYSESQVSKIYIEEQVTIKKELRAILIPNIFVSATENQKQLLLQYLNHLLDPHAAFEDKIPTLSTLLDLFSQIKFQQPLECYARDRLLFFFYGHVYRHLFKSKAARISLLWKCLMAFRPAILWNARHAIAYKKNKARLR